MTRGIEARPGVESRIPGLHRHGIELPLQFAGLGSNDCKKPGHVQVVAGADQQVVVDDDGRHRREVLFVEVGNLDVPALLAGAGIERHEIVVRRLEIEIVAPHRRAAIADVRAAPGLPVGPPEHPAVARVHRPHVVGRGHVQDVVHLQDRALHVGRGARAELAGAHAADDDRRRAAAAPAAAAGRAGGPGPTLRRAVQARVRFFTVDVLICVSAL